MLKAYHLTEAYFVYNQKSLSSQIFEKNTLIIELKDRVYTYFERNENYQFTVWHKPNIMIEDLLEDMTALTEIDSEQLLTHQNGSIRLVIQDALKEHGTLTQN